MKAEKQTLFKLELQGEEVAVFKEALLKIVAVEGSISPNVMKLLDDKETKLFKELFEALNK